MLRLVAYPDDPIRKIALPFAGDPWAQPLAQVPVPESITRLRVTGPSIRWRTVAYDGDGPSAAPVNGDGTTVDMTTVKLRRDGQTNITLARTKTIVENGGVEAPVGAEITEDDVSIAQMVVPGFVSVTHDAAPFLWLFADAGVTLAVEGS